MPRIVVITLLVLVLPLLAAAQQTNPSQPAYSNAPDNTNANGQTQLVQGDVHRTVDPNNPGVNNLGQNASSAVVPGGGAGSFFIALLAGLVLAVAFQLLLTNLSVAAGLNMFGPVDHVKPQRKAPEPEDSVADTVKKITSAFGIWTLVTVIASTRDDMSEDDAEQLLNRIESARDSVVQKAEQMVSEVQRRVEMAKAEVLHQAEETRKVAAGAAWWAFATSLVSGIAAFLGGVLGATMFWH